MDMSLSKRKSQRIPEKHLLLLYGYAKAFDYEDHNKPWKILQEMGIPDHLTCLVRNLYAGQKAAWNNGLVSNWEWSTSRQYIVTLII